MRLNTAATLILLQSSVLTTLVTGFTTSSSSRSSIATTPLSVAIAAAEDATAVSSGSNSSGPGLDEFTIRHKLTFRELQRECRSLGLEVTGNTAALRARLIGAVCGSSSAGNTVSDVDDSASTTATSNGVKKLTGVSFIDESDSDFDRKYLIDTIMDKCSRGHWKSATRKLKQLQNRFLTQAVDTDEEIQTVYATVLEACSKDRLHGARAAEPARKVMEEMVDRGFPVSKSVANDCVMNCVGIGPGGTHDGFGGIDPALAMLHALETSCVKDGSAEAEGLTTPLDVDAYARVVEGLCREGAVDEAILMLRAMVVDHSFTPTLNAFASASAAAIKAEANESVLQVMSLAKAAGYELDSVASAEAGRLLLADGVIAAERMDNLALGLRLLTAAQKAEGCLPDRGDDLVASSSRASQRACTLIHRRAIDKAIEDNNWKLSVRLLELMPERSLTPATSCWRKVVNMCAKAEKSRKATDLLLKWVEEAKDGKIEKPPLNVFNTVINVCEICGEEELTLLVLDAMKKTIDTDGNIITFNIALKRLAKQGNTQGCEGIIMGMLQAGIEPSIVSYTTAIAACVNAGDPALAEEWLRRLRMRQAKANFHTYNTALAACLEKKDIESTKIGSRIAAQMMEDVGVEMESGYKGSAEFNSAIPDTYTKKLVLELNKQLRDNWRSGEIDMREAKSTVRVPLMKIVDFDRTEAAKQIKKAKEEKAAKKRTLDEDEQAERALDDESEIEYNTVRRTMEV